MKNTLVDCFCSLTGSDVDIFEDIIGKKYKKFLKLFSIITDYADEIKKMKYEMSDPDSLSVKIEFDKPIKIEKEDLITELESLGYKVEKTKVKSKNVKIKISYKE